MNHLARALPLLLILGLSLPLAAADPPADRGSVPRFGIGVFGNAGYGTAGLTAVPGATFLFGDFPVKVHFGQAEGVLEAAANADWLLINSAIADTGYSWYVGPGVYGAYGTGGGHQVIGAGARAVVGFRSVILNAWETYAAWTPAFGVGWVDGGQTTLWNLDFELGLRFLFPAGHSEVVVAEAPHPALALVPTLDAFAPGSGGPASVMKWQLSPAYLDRVAAWTLTVNDDSGTSVAHFSGKGAPPSSLGWDGKVAGKAAPEGRYQARLTVDYTDGQTGAAQSRPFAIDLSAPEVTAALVSRRFSPDGDGKNDEALFRVAAKAKGSIEAWAFTVFDPAGQRFAEQKGTGTPPDTLRWNGTGTAGTPAAPGQDYTWSVAVTDDLGKTQAAQGVLSVDFVHPTLTLATDRPAFSPLGNPAKLVFTLGPPKVDAVVGWKLTLTDQNNLPIREFSARGALPSSVSWDGKNSLGLVSEGTIQAKLSVDYTLDDRGTADAAPFVVDTLAPKASVALGQRHFLPDGDGRDETQTFTLASDGRRPLQGWTLRLAGPDGAELLTYSGKTLPAGPVTFDGKTAAGGLVPFGADSTWELQTIDDLGNLSTVKGLLPVDLPRAPVTLTALPAFSPVGSPVVQSLSTGAEPVERLASWKLAIETVPADAAEPAAVVRETTGRGPLTAAALGWDGKDKAGKVVDGSYRARLGLIYDRGEEAEAVSAPFVLDTKKPELTAARPDEPWSPDGDGTGDALNLAVAATGVTPVARWSFTVTDPAGNAFTTLTGEGPLPQTIPWDGRSSTGERVASEQKYAWALTVTDALGKKQTTQGSVTTDILVLPRGNDLTLDLGGLTFQPNKAALVSDASPAGLKNAELLAKLKTLLTRLGQYKITVVGHAVNLSGTAKEEKELTVLSTARAEAVKDALVKLGLDAGRLTAVGKGGTDQLVPDTDTVNRWKNRRVEFVLTK